MVAVDNLSFVVEPGTVTGFLGPNGAGKTTTLRMMLGLVAPSSGSALVNGVAYHDLPDPTPRSGRRRDPTRRPGPDQALTGQLTDALQSVATNAA